MSESSALDKARAAKARAHEVFSKLADVVGVGITTIGSEYGLKVNVSSPPPPSNVLPKEVDGVPVVMEVVGKIRKRDSK